MKNLLFAHGLRTNEDYYKLIAANLSQGDDVNALKLFGQMPKPFRRQCTVFCVGWLKEPNWQLIPLINAL